VKIFWEGIKKAFKELISKWWFVCGVFTSTIVALLYSTVSIIRMLAKGSHGYFVSYDNVMHLLGSIYTYPLMTELKVLFTWCFRRSALLFIAFLLAFIFFGVRSTKSNSDKHFKKVLGCTGIVFFAVNLIAMLVLIFIIPLAEDIRNPPYLSTIENIIRPFSISGFIFIGALANTNKDIFNWKIVIRIIVLRFLFFSLNTLYFYIANAIIHGPSSTAARVYDLFSFLVLAFSLFIYAAALDGETILKSFAKGAQFLSKNLLYALLLSLVVSITRPYLLRNYIFMFIKSRYILSLLEMYIFPLLNPFVEISAFVVAVYYYKLKEQPQVAAEK